MHTTFEWGLYTEKEYCQNKQRIEKRGLRELIVWGRNVIKKKGINQFRYNRGY